MVQQDNSGIIGFWTTARSFFFRFYFLVSIFIFLRLCASAVISRKKKWKKSCVLPRFSLLFKEKKTRDDPFFLFFCFPFQISTLQLTCCFPPYAFFFSQILVLCARVVFVQATHPIACTVSVCCSFFHSCACLYEEMLRSIWVRRKKKRFRALSCLTAALCLSVLNCSRHPPQRILWLHTRFMRKNKTTFFCCWWLLWQVVGVILLTSDSIYCFFYASLFLL